MPDIYFAKLDSVELASALEEKIHTWGNSLNRTGIRQRWMKAYRMYYGRHWKLDQSWGDNEIVQTGEDGELSGLTVNEFRNLIKHMLVLTTNQKPAFDPRASNTDAKSITQTKLAKNILEYYVRDKRLRRYLKTAAEMGLVFGKGFVKCTWDKTGGKPYTVQDIPQQDGSITQKIIYEGDVKLVNLDPFSVFVDQSAENWSEIQWVITREWKNKWDLASRHPELADKIIATPNKRELQGIFSFQEGGIEDTDLIPEYEFYHIKSDSMPNGRYQRFLPGGVVLYDDAIPYSKLPVFRCVAGEYFGSTEGYTEAFDVMNLQQAENVLASTFYTNQSTFGVQNILVPEGSNISALQIAKALQVIKYNPAAGEPKPLQLTSTPPELWKGLEFIGQKMEAVMGLNAVARGNPQEDMSGKALGLLQSMSIQYASNFQESYGELAEDVATFMLVDLIKPFAKTKRVVSIAGRFNKSDIVSFTGQDISDIDRVVVELGNPYSKSLPGRIEMAKDLIANGLIKTPQDYITVLETGNLETMTESPESQQALIRQENESMQDGQIVPVLFYDPHVLHVQEHLAMLSRPDVRMNGQLTQVILDHVMQHKSLWQGTGMDPFYSLVTGEPAAPPPMPMMPPPMPMSDGPQAPAPGPEPKTSFNPNNIGPMPPPGPEQALGEALQ